MLSATTGDGMGSMAVGAGVISVTTGDGALWAAADDIAFCAISKMALPKS